MEQKIQNSETVKKLSFSVDSLLGTKTKAEAVTKNNNNNNTSSGSLDLSMSSSKLLSPTRADDVTMSPAASVSSNHHHIYQLHGNKTPPNTKERTSPSTLHIQIPQVIPRSPNSRHYRSSSLHDSSISSASSGRSEINHSPNSSFVIKDSSLNQVATVTHPLQVPPQLYNQSRLHHFVPRLSPKSSTIHHRPHMQHHGHNSHSQLHRAISLYSADSHTSTENESHHPQHHKNHNHTKTNDVEYSENDDDDDVDAENIDIDDIEEEDDEEIDIDDSASIGNHNNSKDSCDEPSSPLTSTPEKENSFQTYHLNVSGLLDKRRFDGDGKPGELYRPNPHGGLPAPLGWPSHLPLPWMTMPGYPKPGKLQYIFRMFTRFWEKNLLYPY